MVGAGLLILADLVGEKKARPARGGLVVLAGSVLWTVTLVLRDREGAAFDNALAVDNFSLFFRFFFAGVAALVIMASLGFSKRFARHEGEYYALILLATSGMMLLSGARDLLAIFVALELTSISQT